MTSRRHNKLARLLHMDWNEVKTRLGQELQKRSDILQYRVGIAPSTILVSISTVEGKFFFARGGAAGRAQLLRQSLPERADEIVREADEICRHHFHLLGYKGLDYGPEIDWHLDRVHDKRAPLDPCFGIPFLDFAVVGDHKVIWELNRHQHLVTLAKAWLLTHNEKYVDELMAQWRSWMRANPYPLGINWGSALEVAFRSLSWIWVDQLIADAPGYTEFRAQLLPALAFHGRYVEHYLSTYFSPNTHLLGEGVALFFLGTLYPQMPSASKWQKKGWEIVLREAGRQVRPDGVYFEQSLYYHVYALDFFLHARQLAVHNDRPIPATYDGILLTMLDAVKALAQAGPAEGFGDDDGGRLFDPRRNQPEHLTDPLTLGALAYNRDDLLGFPPTEESIWLFGERAVEQGQSPASPLTATSTAFPDGGIYVLADSRPFLQTMMIDAGPQGSGRCGHGHADALSIRLTMNGARWLVDSGSGVYISSDPRERNGLRGTPAHNTIRIDGLDQAVPDGPFSWTNIPTARAERWLSGKRFTYFRGSHDGYARLDDSVTHRRCVLRINGNDNSGLWLIRDIVLGRAEHDLEQYWHFASDVSLQQTGASAFVASRHEQNQPLLRLIFPAQTDWRAEISQGLLSPAYGQYQKASLLRCAGRFRLPEELVTVLMDETQAAQIGHEARLASEQSAGVQVYELRDQVAIHAFFFALEERRTWSIGPWSSDAEMLYCRVEDARLAQFLVIGGNGVAWHDQPLFDIRGGFKFFEWRHADGIQNDGSETIATTRQFNEMTQTSHAPSQMLSASPDLAEKP